MKANYIEIKLVIFDLFGVVFNKGLESSIERLTAVFNRPEDLISKVYRKWEIPFDKGEINQKEFWVNINNDLNTNISPKLLDSIVISAYVQKQNTIYLASHIKKMYKTIVYSNFRKDWFNKLNKKYSTEKFFDDINISSDTGLLKPNKEVFKYLAKKYNVKISNMLLIDDDIKNVKSLQSIGGHAIQFNNIYDTELILRNKYNFLPPEYSKSYSGILLGTSSGALILQRRDNKKNIVNPGKLSVFGGQALKNENPIECALRELFEETGLQIPKNKLIPLKEYFYVTKNGEWIKESYFFISNVNPNNITLKEGSNIEIWYPQKALNLNDLTEVPKILINSLIKENFF